MTGGQDPLLILDAGVNILSEEKNDYFSSKVLEEYSPLMSGHSERKKEKGNFR